jgi:cation/acetate symporter
VSIFYLIAQMVGAGALVSLLLGVTSETAKTLTIVAVGAIMIIYVVIGGMKGTTWVQIVKAVLLMSGATVMTILVLWKFGFNITEVLGNASTNSGKGAAFLEPGLKFGKEVAGDPTQTMWNKLDLLSLSVALVLGTAGLPHVLVRFYTVPSAKEARKSVNWAIANIGVFYLMTIALGFGAAALLSRQELLRGYKVDAAGCLVDKAGAVLGGSTCYTLDQLGSLPAELKAGLVPVDPSGNVAAPLLAQKLGEIVGGSTGGTILLAVIAAVAFATILAVVAGLTLASSSSFAHDFYANAIKRGVSEAGGARGEDLRDRHRRHRHRAVDLRAEAQRGLPRGSGFAIAASANLPALLMSLFWRRFNTSRHAVGHVRRPRHSDGLIVFSKNVSGDPAALFPDLNFAWFPLPNRLWCPCRSFFMGWLGTVTGTPSSEHDEKYAEVDVRSLTGAGAA